MSTDDWGLSLSRKINQHGQPLQILDEVTFPRNRVDERKMKHLDSYPKVPAPCLLCSKECMNGGCIEYDEWAKKYGSKK